MGLPQIPPSETAEKVAPLGAVLNSLPQFADASPSAISGMNSVNTHECAACALGSSFDDFPKNASLEISNVSDKMFYRGAMEVASNVHSLKIDSTESTHFASKSGRSVHVPASRVVGFESGRTSSLTDGLNEVPAANLQSAYANIPANETESASSLVRKRLLSPLSSMLSPSHFKGDPLDIGCRNNETDSLVKNDNVRKSIAQDNKKANIGSKNSYTMPAWSLTSYFEQRNMPQITDSIFQTDGPLLDNRGLLSQGSSPAARIDHLRESSQVRPQTGVISVSPKCLSSTLSLSPLGPKFSERIKATGGCRSVAEEIKDCDITLRSIEQSLNNSNSCLMSNHKDDDLEITCKSFEDIEFLCKDFCPSSLDDIADMNWPISQESNPTSNSMRFTRSLSGLSVRRSLVGSFEESLLSGRFLSGNHTKVCIYANW